MPKVGATMREEVLYSAQRDPSSALRSPRRREELTELAKKCCALFDKYEVKASEKCYVGRLCQAILEF